MNTMDTMTRVQRILQLKRENAWVLKKNASLKTTLYRKNRWLYIERIISVIIIAIIVVYKWD